jgi:hypothetical protein
MNKEEQILNQKVLAFIRYMQAKRSSKEETETQDLLVKLATSQEVSIFYKIWNAAFNHATNVALKVSHDRT